MKSSPENIYLKTCSTSFSGAHSASFFTLNSLLGISKVNSCSNTGFSLRRSRCQMPLHACVLSHSSGVRLYAALWIVAHVHGILQAGILEWVAMPSIRGSF